MNKYQALKVVQFSLGVVVLETASYYTQAHIILPSRFIKSFRFTPIPAHATFCLRRRLRRSMVFERYSGLPSCATVLSLSFAKMSRKSSYKISLPNKERANKTEIFQHVLKMLHHFCCPRPVQTSCLGTGTWASWLVHIV